MISSTTFPEQSYQFAMTSELAYLAPAQSAVGFKKMGFANTKFFDQDGSQAYVLHNKNDIVIVCRGTEPTAFKDIEADLRIRLVVPLSRHGLVHEGFSESVDDLWPDVVAHLMTIYQDQKIWCTGHSLGAAMATVMADRLNSDPSLPDVAALFTYGSPRVGNQEFVESITVTHYRWVNCADIVPRVPVFPYRHHGQLCYMNHWGNVREMTAVQQFKDRLRGFITGWKSGVAQYFVSHLIGRYSDNLSRYVSGVEREQTLF
jgi:triacylglycerol lipase